MENISAYSCCEKLRSCGVDEFVDGGSNLGVATEAFFMNPAGTTTATKCVQKIGETRRKLCTTYL